MRIFVIGSEPSDPPSIPPPIHFDAACQMLAASLSSGGHSLIVCSPFDDSADVQVLKSIAAQANGARHQIQFHFVDDLTVTASLDNLVTNLGLTAVVRIPHPPPVGNTREAWRHAWLYAQLRALDACDVVVAIGGDADGAANMLLQVASARGKAVVPFGLFGGAAQIAFERRRYELADRLGASQLPIFLQPTALARAAEYAELLTTHVAKPSNRANESLRFFVSYPRARCAEADFVEMLLRRRNLDVFRDDHDFAAGHGVLDQINEKLYGADVFIAIWCAEYACSPWCFDELETALDRVSAGLKLWILCIDDTRIIPKRARDVLVYKVPTRPELEGQLLKLLN